MTSATLRHARAMISLRTRGGLGRVALLCGLLAVGCGSAPFSEFVRSAPQDGSEGIAGSVFITLVRHPTDTMLDFFGVAHPVTIVDGQAWLEMAIPRGYTLEFAEGMTEFSVGDKRGFLDEAFRIAVAPIYDDVDPFSEGCAAVQLGNRHGYINRAGEEVLPLEFEYAYPFQGGLGSVKKDGLYGLVRMDGTWALEPRYDAALDPIPGRGFRGSYRGGQKDELLDVSGRLVGYYE